MSCANVVTTLFVQDFNALAVAEYVSSLVPFVGSAPVTKLTVALLMISLEAVDVGPKSDTKRWLKIW